MYFRPILDLFQFVIVGFSIFSVSFFNLFSRLFSMRSVEYVLLYYQNISHLFYYNIPLLKINEWVRMGMELDGRKY